MENRRRPLNMNGSDRGSTSNSGDNSSRSDRTNPSNEHRARRTGLRFTGINPTTWPQRANTVDQVHEIPIYEQRREISRQTRNIPIDQQRETWQNRIDTLPEDIRSQGTQGMNNTLFLRQGDNIEHQTRSLPIDQQRETWQNWINTLDDDFRPLAIPRMGNTLFLRQGDNIEHQTRSLPIDQQRETWQNWINTLDDDFRPLAIPRMDNTLFLRQGDNIEHQTRSLPIDQQRETWQNWINTLDDDSRPHAIPRMNSVLASRQHQNQLPEVGQQNESDRGSTSNGGENSSRSDRTNSSESGSSHPTHDANLRSLDRNRSARNQRAQRMYNLLRNHPIPSLLMHADSRPIQQPGYMAPEQLAGRPHPASDQFVLAAMDPRRIQRQNQLPEVDQQLLERFRQENANRQRHHARVQTILREQQLNMAPPDQRRQEWSNFAANLIVEYEEQHGLGSSRLLGDILQGGTGQATNNERNSNEYKELMTWVLRNWRDHIRE